MKRRLVALVSAGVLALGVGILAVVQGSPAGSEPRNGPKITYIDIPGAGPELVPVSMWTNGQCFKIKVPAKRQMVSKDGGPATETVVTDDEALNRALPPPAKTQRPPTTAEEAACRGEQGPPSAPPPGAR